MSRYPWSGQPGETWWQKHDGEIFIWTLYAAFKIAAWFTTPEMHYLYATLHGHSDDVFGAGVMLIVIKYCWEDTSG